MTKVGTAKFDYAISASATNTSATPVVGLEMRLTLAPVLGVSVIKSTLNFGDIPARATVKSTDKFVLEFLDNETSDNIERLSKIISWSVVTVAPPLISVPSVVGQSQTVATGTLTQAGLAPGTITQVPSTTVASGIVISQSPAAAAMVAAGSSVSFVVSTGPPKISVPNLVGQSQTAAVAAISGAGLTLGSITLATSSTVAVGNVINEAPAAGTLVAPGSAVSLLISSGPAQVAVPAVTDLTQVAATAAITSVGLTLGAVTQAASSAVSAGNVISQSPAAASLASRGSAVSLVISSGPPLVTVPDLSGLSQAAASAALTTVGLTTGTVAIASSTTISEGLVIGQSPAASTQAPKGAAISFTISSGPPVTVSISSPLPGTQIAGVETPVIGTYTGPRGTSVNVNIHPTCISNGAFFANGVSVTDPAFAGITATATSPTGTVVQGTVAATAVTPPAGFLIFGDACGGVAPYNATFSVLLNGIDLTNVATISADFLGSGTTNYTSADLTQSMSHNYTVPGLYQARFTLTLTSGTTIDELRLIEVDDPVTAQQPFLDIITGLQNALSSGNVATALSYFSGSAQPQFAPLLARLGTQAPNFVASLGAPQLVTIADQYAEFSITRTVNGTVNQFVIAFIRDGDGVWKISSM